MVVRVQGEKNRVGRKRPGTNKKDQLALALSCANRPDPADPGGLGAEESGTERTGPTHANLFAVQGGRR
jgi:hypothetical protein